MGLCRSCERFDIRQIVIHTISSRFVRISLDVIKHGMIRQCDFCLVLLAALRRIAPEYEALKGRKEYLYLAAYDCKKQLVANASQPQIVVLGVWMEDIEKNILVRVVPRKTKVIYLPVKADLSSSAATSGSIRGRFSGFRTDSQETVSIISEWLQQCCTSHQICSANISAGPESVYVESPLPTRCLEVTHKTVRLRETSGMRGRYVILSHRWGRATGVCRTTTDNYGARLQGRDLAELTRLFNHAIDITLKLHLRYIWIDSICIIQKGDGGLDWNREAKNMAQYYQDAFFTIFAMRSQKESAGLFVSRQQPFVPLAQLPFRDKNGDAQGHYYITDRQEVDFVEDFIPQVRQRDFFRRGWIFQEWLLSTRIVYFTSTCVWFECKSAYPVMENQEEVDPSHNVSTIDPEKANSRTLSRSIYKADLPGFVSGAVALWYSLLKLYSSLHLTQPEKDRIVAFAGMAKVIRDMFLEEDKKDRGISRCYEYVAGLWLRDIHHGLFWFQKNPHEEYTPLNELPTWSWASSMHAVSWFEKSASTEHAMTVTALATKLPDDDTYSWYTIEESHLGKEMVSLIRDHDGRTHSIGPFDVDNKSCRLRVSAKMIPIMVGHLLDSEQIQFMRQRSNLHGNETDQLKWHSISSENDTESLGGWAAIEIPYLVTQLQDYAAIMVVALHISTRSGPSDKALYTKAGRSRKTIYDILMVEHTGENCYRRVGIGCITDNDLTTRFDECENHVLDLI